MQEGNLPGGNLMPTREELKRKAKERFAATYGSSVGVYLAYTLATTVLSFLLTAVTFSMVFTYSWNTASIWTIVASVAVQLLDGVLLIEMMAYYLRVYRGEGTTIGSFFAGLTEGLGRKVGMTLWKGLWLFIWMSPTLVPIVILQYTNFLSTGANAETNRLLFSLPFIVYGIIMLINRFYAYAMTDFIVRDCVSVRDALKLSIRMMKEYKGEYFVLALSFFGWMILSQLPGVLLSGFAPESETTQWMVTITMILLSALLWAPRLHIAQAGFYEGRKRSALAYGQIRQMELDGMGSTGPTSPDAE